MKALLCVLIQFLKMGGLDYKKNQELMLARLELRGCDSPGEPCRSWPCRCYVQREKSVILTINKD